MIGYVARDKDGSLYLYDNCPVYEEEYGGWFGSPDMINITNQCDEFDDLHYTDEPVKVEINIKRI